MKTTHPQNCKPEEVANNCYWVSKISDHLRTLNEMKLKKRPWDKLLNKSLDFTQIIYQHF